MSIADSFDFHRAHKHISLDRHVKSRVVELGRFVESRTPIYLDINFWILLRNAAVHPHRNDSHHELLSLLRDGVTSGKLLCPVSDAVFLELLKQDNPASRTSTARLIDELSLGVTLLHGQARMGTEVAHFIHSFEDGADLYPLHHLVWSKLSYVLGFIHPHSTQFDDDTQLVIQKAFFDHLWGIPLTTAVEMIDQVPNAEELTLDDIGTIITNGNAQHADSLRSFEQSLRAELKGVADLCADMATQIISNIGVKKGDAALVEGTNRWRECRSMCANILSHTLVTKPEARLSLRTMYVEAALHAALRWDKKRPFKGNDFYDFNHAGAAIGYCRAFFTERPLRVLIQSNKLNLDQTFDCQVICDVQEAIAYLKATKPREN